jgi:uncharacterized DUF497 family protein
MTDAKKTKNGALYFNEEENRVERVLGKVNGQRVWTKFHSERAQDVQTKMLRMADSEECKSYLGDKSRAPSYRMGVIGAN